MRLILAFGACVALSCTQHHHYYPPAHAEHDNSIELEATECSPLLPAPDALAKDSKGEGEPRNAHTHVHEDPEAAPQAPEEESSRRPAVINHLNLKQYGGDGASLVGLATPSLGATELEVWRSSVPVGGETPLHTHSSEEVFIVLKGEGEVLIGEEVIPFKAPATVIAPAGLPHQLRNTGEVPTDQIVVVAIGSKITDEQGAEMRLPWRQ